MKKIDMTEHIRESNWVENVTDPAEVEQSLKAWAFLMEQPVLTHPVMHQTHRLIMANLPMPLGDDQRGTYRDYTRYDVRVGNLRPPDWQDVPDLMDDWLAGHDQRTPWRNHGYFEGIHPRADGNGREGRMYLWRQEILQGKKPSLIVAAFRDEYYRDLDIERRLNIFDMLKAGDTSRWTETSTKSPSKARRATRKDFRPFS